MLIAMAARKASLQTKLEARFGRAPYFILVEVETDEWRVIRNSGVEASGGAGTRAAQILIEEGVDALICGRVGPKASAALAAANIGIYHAAPGALHEVLDAFKAGSLSRL